MKSFETVKNDLLELLPAIRNVLETSGYSEAESLEDYAEEDPSGTEWKELEKAMYHLEKAIEPIEFVNRPITCECPIHKNKNGYYEAENGKEIHAGTTIEAQLSFADEPGRWFYTKVEYSWEKMDYVLFPNALAFPLSKVQKVRFRKPFENGYPYAPSIMW